MRAGLCPDSTPAPLGMLLEIAWWLHHSLKSLLRSPSCAICMPAGTSQRDPASRVRGNVAGSAPACTAARCREVVRLRIVGALREHFPQRIQGAGEVSCRLLAADRLERIARVARAEKCDGHETGHPGASSREQPEHHVHRSEYRQRPRERTRLPASLRGLCPSPSSLARGPGSWRPAPSCWRSCPRSSRSAKTGRLGSAPARRAERLAPLKQRKAVKPALPRGRHRCAPMPRKLRLPPRHQPDHSTASPPPASASRVISRSPRGPSPRWRPSVTSFNTRAHGHPALRSRDPAGGGAAGGDPEAGRLPDHRALPQRLGGSDLRLRPGLRHLPAPHRRLAAARCATREPDALRRRHRPGHDPGRDGVPAPAGEAAALVPVPAHDGRTRIHLRRTDRAVRRAYTDVSDNSIR